MKSSKERINSTIKKIDKNIDGIVENKRKHNIEKEKEKDISNTVNATTNGIVKKDKLYLGMCSEINSEDINYYLEYIEKAFKSLGVSSNIIDLISKYKANDK